MPVSKRATCDAGKQGRGSTYAKFPEVDAINSEIPEPGPLKISLLKFVEVIVEGIPITAMKDSGA